MKSWGRSFQAEEGASAKAMRQEELYMGRNVKEVSVAGVSQGVHMGRQELNHTRPCILRTVGNYWLKRVTWVLRTSLWRNIQNRLEGMEVEAPTPTHSCTKSTQKK